MHFSSSRIANHGFQISQLATIMNAHTSVLTVILKMLSDGMKIRLTSDSSPQELRLLPLDLVQQRQVKGGSKCVMHNGMSLQCHIFVSSFPLSHNSRPLSHHP